MKPALCAAALALLSTAAGTADPPHAKVFGPAQATEIYRVLLDRDALLLESITDVIKAKNIHDGQVVVSSGSVQECTIHYVTSADQKPKNAYKTLKGPFEILGAAGLIANGEPHIHITLSSGGEKTVGGHLENGCRILYLAEIEITKYSGEELTRANNENGVSILKSRQ